MYCKATSDGERSIQNSFLPFFGFVFCYHALDDRWSELFDHLLEGNGHFLVEEPHPLPLEAEGLVLVGPWGGVCLDLKYPIRFWLEGLNLVVSLHAEPQGWGLAGAVADQRGVQVSVFALAYKINLELSASWWGSHAWNG